MPRLVFIFVIALLITSIVGFVGCSREGTEIMNVMPIKGIEEPPAGWHIVEMLIEDIEITISEDRPAHVMVTVTGSHSNTCVSIHEVHHQRQGNTIRIWGTKMVPDGSGDGDFACGDAVTEVKKQVSIGEFTVGAYKIIAGNLEHVFRIEDNESWTIRYPTIDKVNISISESKPAQVTVNIEGRFWEECIPFLKTHQKREGNTIYIQITGEIPSSVHCPLPKFLEDGVEYKNQIPIGEFSTGTYNVVFNRKVNIGWRTSSKNKWFHIE